MKRLTIPYITVSEKEPVLDVWNKILDELPVYPIDEANWKAYPYVPEVNFSIAHTDNSLVLRYQVHEKCTMAQVMEDNGAVWTDSCVEFFISFDDTGYYNFEFNCIGSALLAFRKEKPLAEHAKEDVLKSVIRYPSLPHMIFKEEKGTEKNNWELLVIIPCSAFFKHHFTSLKHLEARANFYKCGDYLSMPHFVSWNPIATPEPNFHVPEFFGEIKFE